MNKSWKLGWNVARERRRRLVFSLKPHRPTTSALKTPLQKILVFFKKEFLIKKLDFNFKFIINFWLKIWILIQIWLKVIKENLIKIWSKIEKLKKKTWKLGWFVAQSSRRRLFFAQKSLVGRCWSKFDQMLSKFDQIWPKNTSVF